MEKKRVQRSDWIAILATFSFGFVAGVYAYLLGFLPQYEKITTPTAWSNEAGAVVVVDAYGGCERTGACQAWRLDLAAGTYRSVTGAVGEPYIGELTAGHVQRVQAALADFDLTAATESVERADCESYVDGIDYRYDIEFGSERYVLDTCQTNFSTASELHRDIMSVLAEL